MDHFAINYRWLYIFKNSITSDGVSGVESVGKQTVGIPVWRNVNFNVLETELGKLWERIDGEAWNWRTNIYKSILLELHIKCRFCFTFLCKQGSAYTCVHIKNEKREYIFSIFIFWNPYNSRIGIHSNSRSFTKYLFSW